MNISYLYWLVSIICSYSLSVGFFGYGIDYYAIYHKSVWGYGHILDHLGMYLVGIHWRNASLGIFAVSILQYIVYYLLFREYSKRFFWCLVAIILSFGWAHFMQSLNMLRQGLSLNILLIFLLIKKTSLVMLMLHTFSHKISAITIPIIFVFRYSKYNYWLLMFTRIIIVILLSYILPTLTTSIRGVDLTFFMVFLILISEFFILRDKRNFFKNKNLVLMFANTMVWYFLVTGVSAYAERVFLSFFPVYFFFLATKVKQDTYGLSLIFSMTVLYVLISWSIGPLKTLS